LGVAKDWVRCKMWSRRLWLWFLVKESGATRKRLTKRAADWWDSARFTSIFLASGFSCSRSESTPAHQRLTQTVGQSLKLP
jgi:hypothetical protein